MESYVLDQYRDFLKDSVRKTIDFSQTDQSLGIPPPPVEKPFDIGIERIDLIPPHEFGDIASLDLLSAMQRRQSRRRFQNSPLSLKELSFLLWATQGVRQQLGGGLVLRTVPSAGARHALETYLCVLNVHELDRGVYRYLPLENQLVTEFKDDHAALRMVEASFRQNWIAGAALVFIWAAIPYRMEWRYDIAAHRVILLDAGHVCQNLYLACEAIGVGTCAIAAYDQDLMDQFLRLNGKDEFAIYMAPVGKC